jgi:hypothetical protein
MRRALVITSLAVCMGVAILSGFAFWGGSGAHSLGPSVAGVRPKSATTTLPVISVPPLAVACNVKPAVPPAKALFRITGQCNLDIDGPAQCTASGGDDFGAYYPVKTVAGDAAYFSLGVEGYTGPKVYKSADVLFFVLYGVHLAQWQAPRTIVTITAGSVIIPRTLLGASPGTGARATLTAQGTLPCKEKS